MHVSVRWWVYSRRYLVTPVSSVYLLSIVCWDFPHFLRCWTAQAQTCCIRPWGLNAGEQRTIVIK